MNLLFSGQDFARNPLIRIYKGVNYITDVSFGNISAALLIFWRRRVLLSYRDERR